MHHAHLGPSFSDNDVRPEMVDAIPAVTHTDGIARIKETIQVLIVDDGNESAVAELVQKIAQQTGLKARYLGQQKRQGPAAARNNEYRLTSGW